LSLDANTRPVWQDVQRGAPAMFKYDDGLPYTYENLKTWVNAPVNLVQRFRTSSAGVIRPLFFAGHASQYLHYAHIGTGNHLLCTVYDNTGAQCCRVQSISPVNDDTVKNLAFSYNPANANILFMINGQDADDPVYAGRIAFPATLPTLSSVSFSQGQWPITGNRWRGSIGFSGFRQGTPIDYEDFFDGSNIPRQIDTTTWAEWNGQPGLWHESGANWLNLGTHGPWTFSGVLAIAPFDTWT
jgi:hypothetical protein